MSVRQTRSFPSPSKEPTGSCAPSSLTCTESAPLGTVPRNAPFPFPCTNKWGSTSREAGSPFAFLRQLPALSQVTSGVRGDSPAGPSSQEEGNKTLNPRSSHGEVEEGPLAASHPRLLQQVARGACGLEQPGPSAGVETCLIPAPFPHCCPKRPRCFLASPSRIWHIAPPAPPCP